MLFITAGMGGGTGTGAAPVVAQVAKELGILTVAVVTKPFTMEGHKRMAIAEQGISELGKFVDSLITIPNQKLLSVLGPKTRLLDAFTSANGVLQGAALLYSGGTPAGFSSPLLRWFMTAKIAGTTPVVFFIAAFVVGAVTLLSRTPFGRRVYGIGNGVRAARFSGIAVGRTLIGVYVLSALCSCLVGVLLTGFSGQASLGMGDDYLLPSIAVVVVGGTIITGGRGQYLGMLGGVLLLTALQTMLAGSNLPYATRAILYGLVVLGAVIALRERRI